jgi:gamma-glutamyl-gamma-aminobutyrate hydrolase PuuD
MRMPVRVPAVEGVNVTAIVHVAATATLFPQVFVSAKSPDTTIEATESATVPELVSITV